MLSRPPPDHPRQVVLAAGEFALLAPIPAKFKGPPVAFPFY